MDNIYSIIGQLPNELKSCFMVFDNVLLSNITEIRLRINKPIIIYILDKPYFISKYDKLINHYTDSVRYLVVMNSNLFLIIYVTIHITRILTQ